MEDVSAQYFEGVDVEVEMTEAVPEDARYCYLCVFGAKGWRPVQWGRIRDGKAVFRAMGKDIVYLPADTEVELWYWDNRWVKGGSLKGGPPSVTFEDIPEGTVYRVRIKGRNDRIFTYEDGMIHWY